MRLKPRLLIAALALTLSLPTWAKKAPIEPGPALRHGEALMAEAEKAGAPEVVPNLWLGALGKLNAAYAAFHKQVEAGARDEDDPEAIAAQRAGEQAEVDAELALVSAQANRDEARGSNPRGVRSTAPARTGGYRPPVTPGQSVNPYPATGGQP